MINGASSVPLNSVELYFVDIVNPHDDKNIGDLFSEYICLIKSVERNIACQ